MKSTLMRILSERGFIHQVTDEMGLDAAFASGTPVPVYIGFDCTAKSLHVGSLVQIMMLRHLQSCGHQPIVLMGGGTTKVGDPSGKDQSRPQLTDDDIAANMAGIKQVFEAFLRFGDGPTDAVMVNNDDWLSCLSYITFLRDYGKFFSVNRMLTRDSVKQRLERESHLSFLEFNYMILQAYDFLELSKRYGVKAQFGGSDQWGNIVEGIELGARDGKELFGLTTPLLTTASGAKMGKTADGAVWLNAEMLSPYHYWQFWRNVDDQDVGRFLRLFTELPMEEIARLEALPGAEINHAKIELANAVTTLLHGEEEAKKAANAATETFAAGGASADLPTVNVSKVELGAGIPAFKLFQMAGLAKSGGEARRLVKGGGAKINDKKLDDAERSISVADANDGVIKLSAGKKRHVLIKEASCAV